MATCFTAAIRDQLSALQEDPSNFAAEFDRWKSLGEAGEYSHYLFGKDGAYKAPQVFSHPQAFRHVHLVPLENPVALKCWKTQWRHRGRKRSDRALVYASDATYGHLLIFILNEPDAHEVPEMRTAEHKLVMRSFCKVAERFVQDGKVIW